MKEENTEREGERGSERERRGIIHSLCAQSAVEITQGNETPDRGERQEGEMGWCGVKKQSPHMREVGHS